jgi:hypothetical protein
MASYDQYLIDAEKLPGRVHWLVGYILTLAGALIEKPFTWPDTFLFAGLMSFPALIISRYLIMPMLPRPYAWLAKQADLCD